MKRYWASGGGLVSIVTNNIDCTMSVHRTLACTGWTSHMENLTLILEYT